MIRALLFDLDGTLLHSAPDLVEALNSLRAREGLTQLPVATLQEAASRGAVGLLQAGMPVAEPHTLERWRVEFLAAYQQNSFVNSRLFEGIPEVLTYLDDNCLPWGIVTNKPEYLTMPILSAAGLSGSISCIVCGDTIEQRKPSPAPVLLACKKLNVAVNEVLFVGDDLRDLEAGMFAGVKTCAALYGYGSAELLKPENLDLLNRGISIDRPAELLDWLQRNRQPHAAP